MYRSKVPRRCRGCISDEIERSKTSSRSRGAVVVERGGQLGQITKGCGGISPTRWALLELNTGFIVCKRI